MRRWLNVFGWISLALVVLVLTLVSPYLLVLFMDYANVDWTPLSTAGQAYGFASAALSGIAFLAVTYSLAAQRWESRAARHEAQRPMHMELLRMAIENPSLLAAGAPELLDKGEEFAKQHLYVNLLVQFWRMNYVGTEVAYPASVSGAARALFRGQAGRNYWEHVRSHALDRWGLDGPRDRQFVDLIDAEYERALLEPPTATSTSIQQAIPTSAATVHLVRGLVAGALIAFLVRARGRRR